MGRKPSKGVVITGHRKPSEEIPHMNAEELVEASTLWDAAMGDLYAKIRTRCQEEQDQRDELKRRIKAGF